MSFKKNYMLLFGLMFITVSIVLKQLNATEYPTPPPVPAKFDSPQEVQRYLNQLHNYYMVVGRPRFGKRGFLIESMPLVAKSTQNEDSNESNDSTYVNKLFHLLDTNGDNSISLTEFKRIFSYNLQKKGNDIENFD